MYVRKHAKPDDVLEPVSDRVVSPRVLPSALVLIRHVGQHNGVAVLLLELGKLIDEPLELVARVEERGPPIEIAIVANVRVH